MDPPGTLVTIALALGAWCLVAVVVGPLIPRVQDCLDRRYRWQRVKRRRAIMWELRRLRKRQTVAVKRRDRS